MPTLANRLFSFFTSKQFVRLPLKNTSFPLMYKKKKLE